MLDERGKWRKVKSWCRSKESMGNMAEDEETEWGAGGLPNKDGMGDERLQL